MSFHSNFSGLGDVLGPILGYFGQKSTNKSNKELARDQSQFQIDASSNAYVRAAKDLKSAGINPILAGQFGGASSPAGALATMMNPMQGALTGSTTAKTVQDTKQSSIKTKLDKLKLPEAEVNAESYKVILAALMEAKRFGSTPEAINYYKEIEAAATNLNNKTHGFIMDSYEKFKKVDKQIAEKYLSLFKKVKAKLTNVKHAGKSAQRLGK